MRILWVLILGVMLMGCTAQTPEPLPTGEPLPAFEETEAPRPEAAEEPQPDRVEALLNSMTTQERVGQLFLARCPEEAGQEDLQQYHLGGYILFGRDFEDQSYASLRDTLAGYRSTAAIAPLLAVDEEGGTVCRVSSYPAFRSAPYPSPRELWNEGGMELVLSTEEEKAALLTGLGINVNMAPVCDMADEPGSFLYRRSLGQSAEITGEFAAGTVEIYRRFSLGSVLKHFPGYGNNADTHVGIAVDERTLESLENRDLLPFQAGIQAGADAILVSHTIVRALDGDAPASLSPAVHTYLREKMGFQGVIVTDDLSMDAIAAQYGTGEAAVLAVLAGNDLLCSTEYEAQYEAVLEAALSGRIPEETLASAVTRILRWKESLGLF